MFINGGSGGARNFIELGQDFSRKFTCDIIHDDESN